MNVLIADDHEITLKGIKIILKERFKEVEVYEALNFKKVIEQKSSTPWDLIMLDAEMPDGDFGEVISQIRLSNKTAHIIVLSSFTKVGLAIKAIKLNANGLIHKRSTVNEMLEAVEKVLAGQTYIHSGVAAELVTHFDDSKKILLHEKLSARELEIFLLIAQGFTVKAIAQLLCLSEKTIGSHLTRSREKTGLKSHVHITRYAFKCGLVS